jgi:Mg-chelatase subunit ChlD
VAASEPTALRLCGQEHALEPGRDYLLGSAADCDLVLPPDAAGHHARLRVDASTLTLETLDGVGATQQNGSQVEHALLRVGDVLRFGATEALVVPDRGLAMLVPLPALRAAAVARRQRSVRRAAAALRHRRDAESFQDLMAQELRRAPWLGGSLALHALLLLLLWLLLPAPAGGMDPPASVGIEVGVDAPPGEPRPAPPELAVEPQAVDFTELPPDATPPTTAAEPPPAADGEPMPRQNPRLAPRPATAGGDGDRTLAAGVQGIGSSSFQRVVADLRRTGLEIVFVFDSTGSMSRTILDTKRTIAQMLTVLRALVPDARVGIVTYRDRGRREEYLVRQVPLDLDFWRASNFVQCVSAEGGGDRPEDVRAGLRAAFQQRWRPEARRVVVLAGDAPPHAGDHGGLLDEVRAFARNGRSFVHTLVTSPETAGRETQVAFAEIAAVGGGECLDLQAHERVLQHVLALAFGRDHAQDVAAVVQAVSDAADRADVAALDLAHRGGAALAQALRRQPVPATVLQALVRRPRRGVALELIEQLGATGTAAHTRHAIAWVLQRVLALPVPPVDPESGDRPGDAALARLRQRTADLPE